MLRHVCAQSYPRCAIQGSDMVEQLPCFDMCKNTLNTCASYASFVGLSSNCSLTKFPELKVRYEKSTLSSCNASFYSPNISNTWEPYLFSNTSSGACSGFITNIQITNTNLSFLNIFNDMNPTGVVQSALENYLKDIFSYFPVWTSSACMLAAKQYFCSSYMLHPQYFKLGNILHRNGLTYADMNYLAHHVDNVLSHLKGNTSDYFKYTISLPSYPRRDLCYNYDNTCGILLTNLGKPQLYPRCDDFVYLEDTRAHLFPESNQSVFSLPLQLPNHTYVIYFNTSPAASQFAPNHLYKYSTDCPQGFVVPEKPEDPRVIWILGSGCAMSCKIPVWTPQIWNEMFIVNVVASTVGLFGVLLLILTWLSNKEKRKQYLVLCFALSSLFATIPYFIAIFFSFEELFCSNNASPIDYTDGTNICNAQSFLLVYSALAAFNSWMIQSIDLYLKVCLNLNNVDDHKLKYIIFIFGSPIVSFLAMGIGHKYGYWPGGYSCFFTSHSSFGLNDWTLYLQFSIATVVGSLAMFAVIYKIVDSAIKTSTTVTHTTSSSSKNELECTTMRAVMQNLNMLRTPILFVTCFLVLAWTVIGQRIDFLINIRSFNDNMTSWVKCVFNNYDGTQSSWQSACGDRPKAYVEAAALWEALAEGGNSILVACIYLPSPSVWRIWSQGLRRVCPTARVMDLGYALRNRFTLPFRGGGIQSPAGAADANVVLLAAPPTTETNRANDKWHIKSFSEPTYVKPEGFTNIVSPRKHP